MRRHVVAQALVGLLTLFQGGLALAAGEPAPVNSAVLSVPSCALPGTTTGQVREALTLELRPAGIVLVAEQQGLGKNDVLIEVESACVAGEPLVLRVSWHDEQRERSFALDELPLRERPRALALSLAELMTLLELPDATKAGVTPEVIELAEDEPSADAEPAPAAEHASAPARRPKPRPAAPPASRASPAEGPTSGEMPPGSEQPATERSSSSALGLAGELRWFFAGVSLAGARGYLDYERLTVGVDGLLGTEALQGGDVSASLVHALLEFRAIDAQPTPRTTLALGPRLGAGLLMITATPYTEGTVTPARDPYLDAALFALATYRVGADLLLGASTELGLARGVVALVDDERAPYDGAFVGLLVHVGVPR